MYVEQLVHMAQTQTSEKTIPTILEQAFGHNNVFVFGEFISVPMVQKVAKSSPKHYATLELFAYSNWETYKKNEANYIKLTDKMQKKLRILSLMDMALKSNKLTYQEIGQKCGIAASVESIEQLVLSAITSQLIEARINQRDELVHILSVSASATYGRDVPPANIKGLVEDLKQWEKKLEQSQLIFQDAIQKDLDQSVKDTSEKQGLIQMQIDENMTSELDKQHNKMKKVGAAGFGRFEKQ